MPSRRATAPRSAASIFGPTALADLQANLQHLEHAFARPPGSRCRRNKSQPLGLDSSSPALKPQRFVAVIGRNLFGSGSSCFGRASSHSMRTRRWPMIARTEEASRKLRAHVRSCAGSRRPRVRTGGSVVSTVAGQRGVHADRRGFAVAHLADHDDVESGRRNGAQRRRKGEPDARMNLGLG